MCFFLFFRLRSQYSAQAGHRLMIFFLCLLNVVIIKKYYSIHLPIPGLRDCKEPMDMTHAEHTAQSLAHYTSCVAAIASPCLPSWLIGYLQQQHGFSTSQAGRWLSNWDLVVRAGPFCISIRAACSPRMMLWGLPRILMGSTASRTEVTVLTCLT